MKLETVMVEIVLGCNLRCLHCPVGNWNMFGDRKPSSMTLEIFNKVLQQVPNGCQVHLGAMGEPTLNQDFEKMAELSCNRGHPTFTTTNATRLHEFDTGKLKELFDGITISVDGWQDSYLRHRRNSDWDVVLRNIIKLARAKGKSSITVASIESILTYQDNIKAQDYWANIGVHMCKLPLDNYCGQLILPAELGPCLSSAQRDWKSGKRISCELLSRCMHVNPQGRAFTCCHDLRNDIQLRGINDPGGLVEAWNTDIQKLRDEHSKEEFRFPCSKCNMTRPLLRRES
jgi:organic radical activating enzyme